jgi:hypothetical protein
MQSFRNYQIISCLCKMAQSLKMTGQMKLKETCLRHISARNLFLPLAQFSKSLWKMSAKLPKDLSSRPRLPFKLKLLLNPAGVPSHPVREVQG